VTTTVTTTVWVINSVHNNTTNRWAFAKATITSGFTNLYVLVLSVTNGANLGSTFNMN